MDNKEKTSSPSGMQVWSALQVSNTGEPQSWLSRRAIWKGWWRMSRDHGFKTSCRKGAVLYLPFKLFLKKIYSFIFGCFGSSLLHMGFLWLQ